MRRSPTAVVALALVAALAGGASGGPSSEARPLGDWIEALGHTDAQIRVEALGAIGKLGPEAEEAVPAMIEALGDADPSVIEQITAECLADWRGVRDRLIDGYYELY